LLVVGFILKGSVTPTQNVLPVFDTATLSIVNSSSELLVVNFLKLLFVHFMCVKRANKKCKETLFALVGKHVLTGCYFVGGYFLRSLLANNLYTIMVFVFPHPFARLRKFPLWRH